MDSLLIIAPNNCGGSVFLCGFMSVLLYSYFLRPIEHFFSRVGTSPPVLNQVFCPMTQCSASWEARTRNPFDLRSSTLAMSHCASLGVLC